MNLTAKTTKIAAFSALAVVLVAGAAYAGYQRTATAAEGAEGATVTVKRGTIQSSVPADGRVVAQQWDLTFGAGGTVDSVAVSDGESVVSGQVLATLSSDKVDAQVKQAKAALASARAKLAAVEEQPRREDVATKAALVDAAESSVRSAQDAYDLLYAQSQESTVSAGELQAKEGALASAKSQLKVAEANLAAAKVPASDSEVAAAKAAVAQAAGGLEAAQSELVDYTLKAPADGVVVSVGVSEGQVIGSSSAQQPAIVVADLSEVQVEGTLDEMDASKAEEGMPAEILIDALDGLTVEGTVDYVAQTADIDQTGLATFLIRVVTGEQVDGLAPGMAVRIQVITDRVEDVLVVPTAAVSRTDGAASVMVVGSDGTAQPVKVELGKTDGKMVEVTSGLEAGQKIALPGEAASPSE